MCGRAGICWMAPAATLFGEVGREALVEALDRDIDRVSQERDERLGLARLLSMHAAERERQADDDELCLVLAHERRKASKPGFGACALDDSDRPRDRSGWVRDGNAGARGAVVEGEDSHAFSAEAISLLPTS